MEQRKQSLAALTAFTLNINSETNFKFYSNFGAVNPFGPNHRPDSCHCMHQNLSQNGITTLRTIWE
jgi:hypothetical protein